MGRVDLIFSNCWQVIELWILSVLVRESWKLVKDFNHKKKKKNSKVKPKEHEKCLTRVDLQKSKQNLEYGR